MSGTVDTNFKDPILNASESPIPPGSEINTGLQMLPAQELKKYVALAMSEPNLDVKLINVINAWETFLHPYTPRREEIYCPVPNPILDSIGGLLSLTALSLFASNPNLAADVTVDRLTAMWPTIWTWMRTLHTHTMQLYAAQIAHRAEWDAVSFKKQYAAVHHALRGFTQHGLPLKLASLVKEAKDIMQMITTLWIEEAKDPTGVLGFSSSPLLCSSESSELPRQGLDINFHVLDRLVERIPRHSLVELVFGRIKRHLKQPHIDNDNLFLDLSFLMLQTGDLCAGAQPLLVDILTHPMVVTMTVDIITLIIDAKTRLSNHQDSMRFANFGLRLIIDLSQDILAYDLVEKLMGTTFLTSMARIASTYEMWDRADPVMEEMCKYFDIILGDIMVRFGVYRSLLSSIQRDLINMQKNHKHFPMIFLGMQEHMKSLQSIFDDYKRGTPVLLSCGNRQCNLTADGRDFRRCSGCCFVCYCSRRCQRRHWQLEHKALCEDMHISADNLDSVRLSGPNMRFIVYMLVRDISGLDMEHILALGRDGLPDNPTISRPDPVRRMLLVLSYANKSGDRVKMDAVHFDDHAAVRKLAARVPQLGELWQSSWRSKQIEPSLRASAAGITLPVLALLPRGPMDLDPQAMTVLLTANNPNAGDEAIDTSLSDQRPSRMHAKLLHYK